MSSRGGRATGGAWRRARRAACRPCARPRAARGRGTPTGPPRHGSPPAGRAGSRARRRPARAGARYRAPPVPTRYACPPRRLDTPRRWRRGTRSASCPSPSARRPGRHALPRCAARPRSAAAWVRPGSGGRTRRRRQGGTATRARPVAGRRDPPVRGLRARRGVTIRSPLHFTSRLRPFHRIFFTFTGSPPPVLHPLHHPLRRLRRFGHSPGSTGLVSRVYRPGLRGLPGRRPRVSTRRSTPTSRAGEGPASAASEAVLRRRAAVPSRRSSAVGPDRGAPLARWPGGARSPLRWRCRARPAGHARS